MTPASALTLRLGTVPLARGLGGRSRASGRRSTVVRATWSPWWQQGGAGSGGEQQSPFHWPQSQPETPERFRCVERDWAARAVWRRSAEDPPPPPPPPIDFQLPSGLVPPLLAPRTPPNPCWAFRAPCRSLFAAPYIPPSENPATVWDARCAGGCRGTVFCGICPAIQLLATLHAWRRCMLNEADAASPPPAPSFLPSPLRPPA